MVDVLRTIASAKNAIDGLYNSALNHEINLLDGKLFVSDRCVVLECNGAGVTFEEDGVVILVDKNGNETFFDNHGYMWDKLSDAMRELFK